METIAPARLKLALIDDSNRLRPVEPAWAQGLAELMQADGQQTPIMVMAKAGPDGRHRLISGGHRVAAARLLDWEDLIATMATCSADEARLLEVDENLARRGLTQLEQALFFAERKAVYEVLHPETKRGGDRKSDQTAMMAVRSACFSAATADVLKKGERTIRRLVALGETLRTDLPADLLQGLLASPHADDLAGLEALRKAEPRHRARFVKAVLGGDRQLSLLEAISPRQAASGSAEDQQLEGLLNAWRKARPSMRDEFIRQLAKKEGDVLRVIQVLKAEGAL